MALRIDTETVEGHPEVIVLHLEGDLDTFTSEHFRERFGDLLKRYRLFVINMEKVDFVSSMGWGALLQAIYRARRKGGDLVLVNLKPQVYRIYKIMGFQTLFKHFDDLDDAVRFLIKCRYPHNI
ncbi:MAG: STAS domain-containing protein [Thermotogae bacterium]|nr:STAS domain-containing protein [Thermotogota bacterium]